MTIFILRPHPQRFLKRNCPLTQNIILLPPVRLKISKYIQTHTVHYQHANKARHLQASSSHQIPKIQTPSGVTADPKLLELLDRWWKSPLQLLNQAKQLFSMQDGANKFSIDFCGKLLSLCRSLVLQFPHNVIDWSYRHIQICN